MHQLFEEINAKNRDEFFHRKKFVLFKYFFSFDYKVKRSVRMIFFIIHVSLLIDLNALKNRSEVFIDKFKKKQHFLFLLSN